MKINNYIFILIIISINIIIMPTAFAKRFDRDGYSIDIIAKEKKNKVKIWGKITGGKKCNQLNIDVHLQNKANGKRLYFNTFIDDYTPKGRNNFNTEYKNIWYKKKFHTKKGKRSWYVDSYYIKCLE